MQTRINLMNFWCFFSFFWLRMEAAGSINVYHRYMTKLSNVNIFGGMVVKAIPSGHLIK